MQHKARSLGGRARSAAYVGEVGSAPPLGYIASVEHGEHATTASTAGVDAPSSSARRVATCMQAVQPPSLVLGAVTNSRCR